MTTAPQTRAEQHILMLAQLADLTMVLCRVASLRACEQLDPVADPGPESEAKAEPAEPPAEDAIPHIRKQIDQDAVLAFTRLSRSLRQTIALEARIAQNAANSRAQATARQNPNITWREIPHFPHEIAKAHLAEAVLHAARSTPAAPDPKSLLRHIDERLDADDIAEAIDEDENLEAIIATVCKDLGIDFDIHHHPSHIVLPLRAAIAAAQQGRGPHHKIRYRLASTPPDDDLDDPLDDPIDDPIDDDDPPFLRPVPPPS